MIPILTSINWPLLILKVMLSGVAVFAAFASCVLILILVQKLSRMDFSRRHIVRLTNSGNVRSWYNLRVESPDPLQFKILMEGIPLAAVAFEQIAPPLPAQQAPEAIQTAQSAPIPAAKGGGGAGKNASSAAASAASQAGKGMAEKSGALASLLGTVGSMLPGKAGEVLKEEGEAARNVQTKTVQTMRAPETLQNKVGAIQKDSGKLGVATPAAPSLMGGNGKNAAQPAAVQTNQPAATAPAPGRAVAGQSRPAGWFVQTKEVSPGECLELVLSIRPSGRRSPEGSFMYTLKSQQIPVEKLDWEAPEVSSLGVVNFKPVAPWRYWLPPTLNCMIIFMELLGAAYFMTLIWL
jgi:hypothetical protein